MTIPYCFNLGKILNRFLLSFLCVGDCNTPVQKKKDYLFTLDVPSLIKVEFADNSMFYFRKEFYIQKKVKSCFNLTFITEGACEEFLTFLCIPRFSGLQKLKPHRVYEWHKEDRVSPQCQITCLVVLYSVSIFFLNILTRALSLSTFSHW